MQVQHRTQETGTEISWRSLETMYSFLCLSVFWFTMCHCNPATQLYPPTFYESDLCFLLFCDISRQNNRAIQIYTCSVLRENNNALIVAKTSIMETCHSKIWIEEVFVYLSFSLENTNCPIQTKYLYFNTTYLLFLEENKYSVSLLIFVNNLADIKWLLQTEILIWTEYWTGSARVVWGSGNTKIWAQLVTTYLLLSQKLTDLMSHLRLIHLIGQLPEPYKKGIWGHWFFLQTES